MSTCTNTQTHTHTYTCIVYNVYMHKHSHSPWFHALLVTRPSQHDELQLSPHNILCQSAPLSVRPGKVVLLIVFILARPLAWVQWNWRKSFQRHKPSKWISVSIPRGIPCIAFLLCGSLWTNWFLTCTQLPSRAERTECLDNALHACQN